MKPIRIKFLTTLLMLFVTTATFSQVVLPPFFNCNMVLQKGIPIPVWGWASPGEKVTVSLEKSSATTRAGKDGKWKVSLPKMEYGGPYKMVIKGKNLRTIENVMIGEVWICSGQSNMEFRLSQAKGAAEEIKQAANPNIRIFTVKRRISKEPQVNLEEGEWWECTPESVPNFSAVAYYFGKELYKKLNVPIGLIHSSWGGTIAESWTSKETNLKDPDFAPQIEKLAQTDFSKDKIGPNSFPSLLYNGMIAPVIPYGIRGAIWYQGESNASRAQQYKRVFPNLITDWRKKWNQGDFPFLFVQLANFKKPADEPGESDWAELREAQTQTLSLPNTGMATIIDCGEANNIHPTDKQTVGYRLSLAARKVVYGESDLVYTGPTFKSMKVDGNSIIVTFDNVGKGLVTKNRYGYVNGFAISSAGGVFKWGKATIESPSTIRVSCEGIKNPAEVRYGWADNPDDLNLYNNEGLPANPFRTDSRKGITK